MISILEKAIQSQILLSFKLNRKYLFRDVFSYIHFHMIGLRRKREKERKKNEEEKSSKVHVYAQRPVHQTTVFVHREYNYYHAACMHKVSTFLF